MNRTEYLTHVMELLQSNPTAQHLDEMVSAFAIISNLAADAQSIADEAEARRKYAMAEMFAEAKSMRSDKPLSDTAANNYAILKTKDEQQAEIDARTKAKKIVGLLAAVEQCINAIKFLGRYDAAPSATIKLPGSK